MVRDRWATSKNASIHYLDSECEDNGETTPIVYVPGAFGFAEQFRDEMDVLSNRRCIALSLRGRGKSEAPLSGYSFQHHVSDIVDNAISKGLLRKEREYVVTEIMKESNEVSLRDHLQQIHCPVLVLRGGTNQSLLNETETEVYENIWKM